jgi:hypothetical protein
MFGGLAQTALLATTHDLEGGDDCCIVTWKSNVDGVLGAGKSLTYPFVTSGTRTITATAKDAFGNETSDTVTISTENLEPMVFIGQPAPGQSLWRGLPYAFTGWAWDSEIFSDLPCSALSWSGSNLADPFPVGGCAPQLTFLTAGSRSTTLTAVDGDGGVGKTTRVFTVAAPPTGGPPIASILKPQAGHFVSAQDSVVLAGTAQDTDNAGGNVTYQWILNPGPQQKVLHTEVGPSGGQSTFQWHPSNDIPFSCGGGPATIQLHATDPEGASSDEVTIFVGYPPC